jgi:organic radical activating enzyme
MWKWLSIAPIGKPTSANIKRVCLNIMGGNMKQLNMLRERFFPKFKQLPSGFFPYQSSPEVNPPYRLQLRLEEDGSGVLVVNARTVLHLNQTAAEMAYHHIKNDSIEDTAREISKRYNVPYQQALDDVKDFLERIVTTVNSPTLDPITYLDFDRVDPYSTELSAPYRLDCALTYKTNDETPQNAPIERVKRELLTEEWRVILQKAWQVGIPQIVFTGGEPTLRPDLFDLIAITQNQGQVTGLLTDGKRLSERDYLHKLMDSGLDHVMIALDTESSQAWEGVRDTSKEPLFMTVHLTINPHIISQIDSLLDKLDQFMGDNRSLSLSVNHKDLSAELTDFRNKAVRRGFEIVWDLPVPYSGLNPVAFEIENAGDVPRGTGNAWLYVEPDGDVLPAQGITTVLGNFLTDSWEKIWSSRK